MTAIFPQLDQGGTVYKVQLFSQAVGGVPIVIGMPDNYATSLANAEAEIADFAGVLAAKWGLKVTEITKYATTQTTL